MFCVGLTGNIASGKSTALRYFRSLGVNTLSADVVARQLTEPGQAALGAITTYFGEAILHSDGTLNRALLRKIIFQDASKRLWLENLLHPLIREAIHQALLCSDSEYSIIEIPLLIRRESFPYIDRILVISSTKEKQVQRVMARDSCSSIEAESILDAQPSEEARHQLADDIVINNDSLDNFEKNIKKLHEKYLQLSYNRRL